LKAACAAILDVEPCTYLIQPRKAGSSHLLVVSGNRIRQTVKLTTHIIGLPLVSDMLRSASMSTKPPAYLFRYPSISKSTETKSTSCAPSSWRRQPTHSQISSCFPVPCGAFRRPARCVPLR